MTMFESWKQVHSSTGDLKPVADDKKVVVRPLPSPARVPFAQPHAKPASKKAAKKVDEPLPPFTTPTPHDVNMFFHKCKSTSATTLATEAHDHDAETQAADTMLDTFLEATLPGHDGSVKQEAASHAPAAQQMDTPAATPAPAAAAHAQVAEAATTLTIPKDVVGLVHPNFRKKPEVVHAACKPGFAAFVAELRADRDDDGFRFGEDASDVPELLELWSQRQLDITHAETSAAVQVSLMRPDTKDLAEGSRPELQPAGNLPQQQAPPSDAESPEAIAVAAPSQQQEPSAPAAAPTAHAEPNAVEAQGSNQHDADDGARGESLHA